MAIAWAALLRLAAVVAVMRATSPAAAGHDGSSSTAACPLDLGYVRAFPWDRSPCVPPVSNQTACCTTLRSVLGVGLAARLRATGHFRLPSADASSACLRAFAGELASPPLSLPADSIVPACWPVSSQLAISRSYCAGVTTADQYVAAVGSAAVVASLNSSCGSDLAGLSLCSSCLTAAIDASGRLVAAAAKGTDPQNCFYLTVLYAAGIASSSGPTSPGTANCALGLAISTASSSSSPASSSNHTNMALSIAISIASVLTLVSIIGELLVWRRRLIGFPVERRSL